MPHNAQRSKVMKAIVGNLMPLCEKQANPELWFIYEEMQKWEMLVESKFPMSDGDEPAQTIDTIKKHLPRLIDRDLAHAIEHALGINSPQSTN